MLIREILQDLIDVLLLIQLMQRGQQLAPAHMETRFVTLGHEGASQGCKRIIQHQDGEAEHAPLELPQRQHRGPAPVQGIEDAVDHSLRIPAHHHSVCMRKTQATSPQQRMAARHRVLACVLEKGGVITCLGTRASPGGTLGRGG